MKFAETASPDILEIEGPHHVSRNFGNTLRSKFRQQLQKLDFYGEKNAKIGIFDCSFWEGRGCAWSEIFFWDDPHWLGVKPHGRPKRRPGPPQPTGNRFWPPRIEKSIFSNFLMKISHFWSIFACLQGGPLIPEISSSNESSKIYLYEGRTQKSATFEPPNPRSQNLTGRAIFKAWRFENGLSS